jgi:hypothetical protein
MVGLLGWVDEIGERDMLGEIKRDGGSAEDIPSSQVRMAKVDGLERSLRLSVGYKDRLDLSLTDIEPH